MLLYSILRFHLALRGGQNYMNIGFDLDKIFINTPPFIPDRIIEILYRKKSNGILLYRIPGRSEQIIRKLAHFRLFRPPINKNINFLRSASRENNKLYLISSRFSFLKNVTDNLIRRHRFDKAFDYMYFNFENKQPHIFKNEYVKKLRLDMYIDDDLPLLKFIAGKNPKTKFFWLNKKISKPLGENLVAIKNLFEAFNPHFLRLS